MWDDNWEDWHLRPDGSGEGALLKGKHLLVLCAVVAGAFWEDDHMRPPLFGLQLKFGSVECQILKSETIHMCSEWQCLFPSMRYQSFNQLKHEELSKKGFRTFQWRRSLQIQVISWPMPNHPYWLSSLLTNHVSVSSTRPDSLHQISVAEMKRKVN